MSSPHPSDTEPRTCQAHNCSAEVAPAEVMCPPHWSLVPAPLRETIKASYQPGEEGAPHRSTESQAIIQAAIDAVAHKESRSAPRRPAIPRSPRKPVQLTLFELS
jgi:hypothetical protein